jgi:DNA polymerase III delta prime subunit
VCTASRPCLATLSSAPQLLLLCGPPGLGKTTLAHVLARQAGYQVLEINASDDRSAKVVHERIRAALESTALTIGGASSTRPTCVIIDEIDGATGGGDSVRAGSDVLDEPLSTTSHTGLHPHTGPSRPRWEQSAQACAFFHALHGP